MNAPGDWPQYELVPLPAQPHGVPWPTEQWPTGELVAHDQGAVEASVAQAFADQPHDDLALTLAVGEGLQLTGEVSFSGGGFSTGANAFRWGVFDSNSGRVTLD